MFDWLADWSAKRVRWTDRGIEKWRRTRSLGRSRFVWRVGVLGWGLTMFVLMSSYFHFQDHGLSLPSPDSSLALVLVLNMVVWMICGYLFGTWLWTTSERSYRRHTGLAPDAVDD